MTFNHFEISTTANNLPRSTHLIYDGSNISVIHDGTHRYLFLKNINTGVKFIEPNTTLAGSETAFIIGSNTSNLYFLNPTTRQVRTINTNGVTINEQFYNLNDFNRLKDLQYGSTGNNFIPTCGHVTGSTIVIGGYTNSMQPGVVIDSKTIGSEVVCYMYSTDSGSTFEGPVFPFINPSTGNLYTGRVINTLFVNDNWIFYVALDLGSTTGTNLNFVQTLGVDFIGNNIFDPFLETPGAPLTNWSLPMVYFDKKIFFQDSSRTGYHIYDFTDDSNTFTVAANITAMTVVVNELRITDSTDCDPIVIPAENEAGAVTITTFDLNGGSYTIDIGLGKTFIDESDKNATIPMLAPGALNTSHFLQPAILELDIVI